MFALDDNTVREFRIQDIVQQEDTGVIKSSERNTPSTDGRLVKLKPKVASTEGERGSGDSAAAATAEEEGNEIETQSGEGSTKDE